MYNVQHLRSELKRHNELFIYKHDAKFTSSLNVQKGWTLPGTGDLSLGQKFETENIQFFFGNRQLGMDPINPEPFF